MNSKGFSIVELIVSTSLIAIISVIAFVGYRQSGRGTLINDQADVLVGSLETVRGMSLSATEVLDEDDEQVDYFTVDFVEEGFYLLRDTDSERFQRFEENVIITDGNEKRVGFQPPYMSVQFWEWDEADDEWEKLDRDSIEVELNLTYGDEDPVVVEINRVGLVQKR